MKLLLTVMILVLTGCTLYDGLGEPTTPEWEKKVEECKVKCEETGYEGMLLYCISDCLNGES